MKHLRLFEAVSIEDYQLNIVISYLKSKIRLILNLHSHVMRDIFGLIFTSTCQ